jgi:hypothetical protein
MRPGLRSTRTAIALGALAAAIAMSGLIGCTQADAPQAERGPTPPIDLKVPERLETATFAMG